MKELSKNKKNQNNSFQWVTKNSCFNNLKCSRMKWKGKMKESLKKSYKDKEHWITMFFIWMIKEKNLKWVKSSMISHILLKLQVKI